jgi:hypothetical protein
VRHLAERNRSTVRTGIVVTDISAKPGPETYLDVAGWDARHNQPLGWRVNRVIFAAPQFVASRVIGGYEAARGSAVRHFQYGAWLVANLHLAQRPVEPSFPLSWDNVIYDSPGLGYVVATHQRGKDDGPTVLTYYRPLCDDDPVVGRQWLQDLSWTQCAELVLADLEQAHADIRSLVGRLDVMKWGHAMIRPAPGFQFSLDRRSCAAPYEGVHFAHTDLSGMALFEEAFDQGLRAANAVMRSL